MNKKEDITDFNHRTHIGEFSPRKFRGGIYCKFKNNVVKLQFISCSIQEMWLEIVFSVLNKKKTFAMCFVMLKPLVSINNSID